MKSLIFQLKVLYKSLKLPLSFVFILTYSFIFCYTIMVIGVSFIELNTKYIDLNEWDNFGRLLLLVFTLAMTFTIFGNKIKLLK